jgi:hypothetical protein
VSRVQALGARRPKRQTVVRVRVVIR